MEMLERFYCWPLGLGEADAKIIKTTNAQEAAKKAVDSWRDEGSLHTLSTQLVIQVKDGNGKIQNIYVNQESHHETIAPRP